MSKRKPSKLKTGSRLMNAVTGLMEIVEGTRRVRWSGNGRRLVDTEEWCELYCAWWEEKRKQDAAIHK